MIKKYTILEKKLPLNFKYMHIFGSNKTNKIKERTQYITCIKYQTDNLERVFPFKNFTRML